MRMRHVLATLTGVALTGAPVLLAQTGAPGQPVVTETITVDATALGVSFERIHRRLAADSQARASGVGPVRLEYHIDVYGTAPALRFFTGQDLVYGGVPGSAPTHSDMLYMFTPQEFRAPTVNFFGLATSAARAGAKKLEDWRYQRDLRAYQKLVEAGRNIPAPKPPREQ
jgi:hypothetical protein